MVSKCPKVFSGREGFEELKKEGFTRKITYPISDRPLFSSDKQMICKLADKNKGNVKIFKLPNDLGYTLLGSKKLKKGFELKT